MRVDNNIIAAAGLGAGLALAGLAEEAGGRLRLMGTPAEEGGGGKIEMARKGAFASVDAAMMIHPADRELARMNAIAIQHCLVKYTGEAAHAAVSPHLGRNALDAAVLGYMNIASTTSAHHADRAHSWNLFEGWREAKHCSA